MKLDNTRCQAVLFDLDGTLLDTIPLIMESFQHVYQLFTGQPGDPVKIRQSIGTPLEQCFSEFAPGQIQNMISEFTQHNQQRLDSHVAIFLGILPLLEKLRERSLKMGIVTSKRLETARHSLRLFDIERYFDVVIGKESTATHKPAPEPVWTAIEKLGLEHPDQAVFVGDSMHDLISAQNAGCVSAIAGWTGMPRFPLYQKKPDLWINQPDQLVQWLDHGLRFKPDFLGET